MKLGQVKVGDIKHFKSILDTYEQTMQDLYKDGKAGFYKITKTEGTNNEIYRIGNTEYGFSYGIVKGLGMRLENASRWFNTSIVNDIEWTSDITGVFKTANSTYTFEYSPDKTNYDTDNEGSEGEGQICKGLD